MRIPMKILMVLTSHDKLGSTGQNTGFWLEEFAAPYYVFKDAGAKITLASPLGGQPPIDPKSGEAVSRPTPPRRLNWPARPSYRARGLPTSTPSSIRAAMARCGIWRKTSRP